MSQNSNCRLRVKLFPKSKLGKKLGPVENTFSSWNPVYLQVSLTSHIDKFSIILKSKTFHRLHQSTTATQTKVSRFRKLNDVSKIVTCSNKRFAFCITKFDSANSKILCACIPILDYLNIALIYFQKLDLITKWRDETMFLQSNKGPTTYMMAFL